MKGAALTLGVGAALPSLGRGQVPGANDKVVVGVIGAGRMGLSNMEAFLKFPEVEVAAPMAPNPAEAIDDYYILLRQGMYDVAWSRTTTEFQETNYPAGYPGYLQAWSGVGGVEVLASGVVWQNREEASVVAELRDTDADRLFKNAYLLRFDPDRGLWSIVSISSVW